MSTRLLATFSMMAACAMGQTAPGTLTTLFNFPLDAGQPQAGVLIGPGGVLYGSDWRGGSIYSLTPPATGHGWTSTVLYTFPMIQKGQAGYSSGPNNLAMDGNGVLYGTNNSGGNLTGTCEKVLVGCGSVYSMTPPALSGGSWTFTNIYEFT